MNKEEIKSKISIFDICKEYGIKVKRNRVLRCPFHNDRHASGVISKDGRHFHCFACGKNLDVFGFVMEIEKIPFLEAYKKLGGEKISNNKQYLYERAKRKKKRRAKEIFANIDYTLANMWIDKKKARFKRLERELFNNYPSLKEKPCWFDYFNEDRTKHPHLIKTKQTKLKGLESYLREQYSIELDYEFLDEMLIRYKKQGYFVKVYSPKEIIELVSEYILICRCKLANIENIDYLINKWS